MPSSLLNDVRPHAIYGGEEGKKLDISSDTPEYFTWLSTIKSFHFKGKAGHFTAQLEQKQRGVSYWYAYRKHHKHQFKQYIGTTDKLTINRLEEIAGLIQEKASQLPTPERKPRKSPVPKQNLRDTIAHQKKIIEQQQIRITELENELKTITEETARKRYQQIIREHRSKRDSDLDF
jgi:hypothetical protein